MSRAAFIMDRLMHKIGLHGQSVIPLLMGFGCNVPAILATRTIKDRKNRLLTMFIMPFMSCSTKFPIYILLAGTFFSQWEGFIVALMYVTGIMLAIITAKIFNLFRSSPKEDAPFVMELPPYRIPTMKSLFINAWHKGKHFLVKVGTWILLGSIAIWGLSHYKFEWVSKEKGCPLKVAKTEQPEKSALGQMGQAISPVMSPLGFNDNMSVSLLSGLFAKEIVVSTLGIIYGIGDMEDDKDTAAAFLNEGSFVMLTKIEDNTKINIAKKIVQDTSGILYELTAVEKNEKALQRKMKTDIEKNIENNLAKKNLNNVQIAEQKAKSERAVSLSFILFILIYFPCISTIIIIKKESGSYLLTASIIIYTLILAWIVSFIAYTILSHFTIQHIGTFILVVLIVILLVKYILRKFMKRKNSSTCKGCSCNKTCSE
jgi:ferrous iron transport protein B